MYKKFQVPEWVSGIFGTPGGTRLHFHSHLGMKIKVRLGPALAGGARP